jgi:Phage integrase, N-terminal SAM-like domain
MWVELQLSGAKPSTQRTYLREARNLAKYFHKSPEQLGEDELKEYLLDLMKERHLSEGTFWFYVAGLKFLYRTTLKREWAVDKIRPPRAKRKLPVVLDLTEVESLFCVTKMITEENKQKRQSQMTLPFPSSNYKSIYFLNFLLNPQSPSNPEPRSNMVAGSGTVNVCCDLLQCDMDTPKIQDTRH